MVSRQATHAGSWYSSNSTKLSEELSRWLAAAEVTHGPAQAIIVPHASYQYSGPCAAYAYKQINPSKVKRIFILGPSHHKYFTTCALTTTLMCETPLYDLRVDTDVNNDLNSTELFEWMNLTVDQNEHSIELQLPYIAKVMEEFINEFTIVPILVGSLTPDNAMKYGKALSKYLASAENLFVISSDFCHWGNKFGYTYLLNTTIPIYQSINSLDLLGMDAIETLEPNEFSAYLNKYNNTICGRNPILILLHTVNILLQRNNIKFPCLKFLKYEQSKQCDTKYDFSVSYAAASMVLK